MNKRTLITAALPYTNGYVHLGHCAGAYLPADIYARFLRLQGHEVLFICGSDEHGAAISIAAEKEQISPKEIIDKYHVANKDAFAALGMSFDYFGRTSSAVHHNTAQEFFLNLLQKNVLISKEEDQFYDVVAERFLPDRYVEGECPNCGSDKARGDQCDKCGAYYNQTELKNPVSRVSGKTPVVRKTTHFYFQLGHFQQFLEEYLQSHPEWKDNVKSQTLSWLKKGMGDRAITRDLDWGVPLPLAEAEYTGKVLYVWFEAVLGYISATKEWAALQQKPQEWELWWKNHNTRYIAFIGKDNIVFHTLIFPAILQAAGGYILPDNVPANEFLNLEGEKFSKSRNWSIDLRDFLADFPAPVYADALRYTLMANMPEARDADFTWRDFQNRTNNELAAIIGNYINRVAQFLQKYFAGKVPTLSERFKKLIPSWNLLADDIAKMYPETEPSDLPEEFFYKYHSVLSKEDVRFISALCYGERMVAQKLHAFRYKDALAEALNTAREANKYFNDAAPWKLAKQDMEACAAVLFICVQAVRSLALLFRPVLPYVSDILLKTVGSETSSLTWKGLSLPAVAEDTMLQIPDIIFPKIEDDVVERQVAKLAQHPEHIKVEPEELSPNSEVLVDFADFTRLRIQVGLITSAHAVPKSKKLLQLQVQIGERNYNVVSGIAASYSPDDIIGKKIVAVTNLKPATIMGLQSEAMLLAANAEKSLRLLFVEEDVPDGTIIK